MTAAQHEIDGAALGHLSVERAVRLHRRDLGARRRAHRGQGPQLLGQGTLQLVAVDVHGPAAEALAVGVGRVRPHPHAVLERGRDGRRHGLLVARVAAARHVGAGHEPEQAALRLDRRRLGRLTDVRVEVDGPRG